MRWQELHSFDIDIHKVVSDSALDLAVFPEVKTKYRIIRGKPLRVPDLKSTIEGEHYSEKSHARN